MKIHDILNLFLQQEYTISEIEMNHVDYLVMDMPEANGQLYISCPISTEVVFLFRYLHDKNGRGTMHFPKLSMDIEEVKPFLNKLVQEFEIKNNLSLTNTSMQEKNKIFGVMKLALEGQQIPTDYSLHLSKLKDGTILVFHVRDNVNNKGYNIDFRRLDLDYLPNGVASFTSLFKVYVDTFDFTNENSSPSLMGSFVIPGYELDKYPLLQKYNKIQTVHTNVYDWAKELANFPNLERGNINVALESLVMNEELPENTSAKRKSPKL